MHVPESTLYLLADSSFAHSPRLPGPSPNPPPHFRPLLPPFCWITRNLANTAIVPHSFSCHSLTVYAGGFRSLPARSVFNMLLFLEKGGDVTPYTWCPWWALLTAMRCKGLGDTQPLSHLLNAVLSGKKKTRRRPITQHHFCK